WFNTCFTSNEIYSNSIDLLIDSQNEDFGQDDYDIENYLGTTNFSKKVSCSELFIDLCLYDSYNKFKTEYICDRIRNDFSSIFKYICKVITFENIYFTYHVSVNNNYNNKAAE